MSRRSAGWCVVFLVTAFTAGMVRGGLRVEPGPEEREVLQIERRLATPSRSRPTSVERRPDLLELDEEVRRRRDIRGNEILRPVARYRLDPHGDLYEVHSPQTELPRLKPPRT